MSTQRPIATPLSETWFAAVQYLPRPIYHGIGHSGDDAMADALANDCETAGLLVVPITRRLAQAIMDRGGDLPENTIIRGKYKAPHDLAIG